MRFTDSPFEKMMREIPWSSRPELQKPQPDSPCQGCTYWRGMACVGICLRELTAARKEAGASGQNVQKPYRA